VEHSESTTVPLQVEATFPFDFASNGDHNSAEARLQVALVSRKEIADRKVQTRRGPESRLSLSRTIMMWKWKNAVVAVVCKVLIPKFG
jgi:hypothetical protein